MSLEHPFFRGLRAPLHIAHRGGAALAPENTLAAFEQAVRVHRTDMLELDLQVTRDGVLVVSHDATVDRCTDGQGAIREARWDELAPLDAGYHFARPHQAGFPFRGHGIGVPRFVDVLDAFPKLRLNVELKDAGAIGPFVDLLRKRPLLERLCIGGQEDDVAAELAKALPEACLFFPQNALAAFVLPVKAGEEPEDDARYSVLDMPYVWEGVTLFDGRVADAGSRHQKWVNVWTVDDAVSMRQAIADDVGGVMTDRPDVLRVVLDELAQAS